MKLKGDALVPAAHVTFGELFLMFPNQLKFITHTSWTLWSWVGKMEWEANRKSLAARRRTHDGIKDGVMKTKEDALTPAAYVTFSELFMNCRPRELWVQCQLYNDCTPGVLYDLKASLERQSKKGWPTMHVSAIFLCKMVIFSKFARTVHNWQTIVYILAQPDSVALQMTKMSNIHFGINEVPNTIKKTTD